MADLGLSPSQPKKGDKKKTEVSLQLVNTNSFVEVIVGDKRF